MSARNRRATIRLEEVPWDFFPRLAMPGQRVWLFLDYEGWGLGRLRWVLVARPAHEDFQLMPGLGRGSTHERALDLIPHEVELAKQAIEMIRQQIAEARDAKPPAHLPSVPIEPPCQTSPHGTS